MLIVDPFIMRPWTVKLYAEGALSSPTEKIWEKLGQREKSGDVGQSVTYFPETQLPPPLSDF